MGTVSQGGFEWIETEYGLEVHWTDDPNTKVIERLGRKYLELSDGNLCHVSFHAEGVYNKLYCVHCIYGDFVMRVSLPVDPHYKTQSEVATMRFVQQKTHMPVPRIVAFDDSNENELGFEWILMELMPGKPLREQWRKMSMQAKRDLVSCVARYQTQLSGITPKLAGIGSLFSPLEQKSEVGGGRRVQIGESEFSLGRIVSQLFFWGDNVNQDVDRGPFRTSGDWLRARLSAEMKDQNSDFMQSDDEGMYDVVYGTGLAKRLIRLLPLFFESHNNVPENTVLEQTVLWHNDLSEKNIFVDESGRITGVVDWECISTIPMWGATLFPRFLVGDDRREEPARDAYPDKPEEEDSDEEGLDNEGKNQLYWEHQAEYEKTQLRQQYSTEIERLWPEGKLAAQQSVREADFEVAVSQCGSRNVTITVLHWVNDVELGHYWSLKNRLQEILVNA